HFDDLSTRRPTNQGVIHDNDALSLENFGNRVELYLHPKMADRLLRLNECAPDIVIADKPSFKGKSRTFSKPQGGRHSGIRNRNHDVRRHSRFLCELSPKGFANGIHSPTAENTAIRASEVHVLENAHSR